MDRHRVSYDDIAPDSSTGGGPPPAKRGKWTAGNNNRQPHHTHPRPHAHWDEPTDSMGSMSYDTHPTSFSAPKRQMGPTTTTIAPSTGIKRKAVTSPSASVNFTDPTLWDDSELTNAWDAANEEYEVSL